jgi:hypothetical protein
MSAPADIIPAATPTAAPRQRKPMRMTPAKLRAQRANARLSTGPRTQDGRRRSAQNSRGLPFSPDVREDLERQGADLAEVKRLWQDVMAVFWFIDSDCHYYLQRATWHWWQKLNSLRHGGSPARVKCVEGDIEKCLRQALERFAKRRQRWERWLAKELGADVREGVGSVRAAVESRLEALQRTLGS